MWIVQFDGGRYAIMTQRRIKFLGITFQEPKFLDLVSGGHSWYRSSEFFKCCLTTDRNFVEQVYSEYGGNDFVVVKGKKKTLKDYINKLDDL